MSDLTKTSMAGSAEPGARPVSIQPVRFEPLAEANGGPSGPANIQLLMDVPLRVAVELGRTRMLVRQVLELRPGSVVELDRMAGDSVDVLVNNRLMARGEVVVVDDKFGIRITELVQQTQRAEEAE